MEYEDYGQYATPEAAEAARRKEAARVKARRDVVIRVSPFLAVAGGFLIGPGTGALVSLGYCAVRHAWALAKQSDGDVSVKPKRWLVGGIVSGLAVQGAFDLTRMPLLFAMAANDVQISRAIKQAQPKITACREFVRPAFFTWESQEARSCVTIEAKVFNAGCFTGFRSTLSVDMGRIRGERYVATPMQSLQHCPPNHSRPAGFKYAVSFAPEQIDTTYRLTWTQSRTLLPRLPMLNLLLQP